MNPSSRTPETLFSAALARPAAERAAFLDGACGDDVALRARLDALLAAHEGPESLMAAPALAPTKAPMFAEEAPGDHIARYKLLQQIGEGGCGVVWMAEQEEPVRRRVALKVIKLGMDTKAVVARPVRGRAAGPGHDGSPQHREGPQRRDNGDRPAILCDGTGARDSDYEVLRGSYHAGRTAELCIRVCQVVQ